MTAPIYGREALRRFREEQNQAAQEPEHQPSLLEHIPPDAPMDDATLTVWNGERFVAWEKWRASTPVAIEVRPEEPAAPESDTGKQGSFQKRSAQEGLW